MNFFRVFTSLVEFWLVLVEGISAGGGGGGDREREKMYYSSKTETKRRGLRARSGWIHFLGVADYINWNFLDVRQHIMYSLSLRENQLNHFPHSDIQIEVIIFKDLFLIHALTCKNKIQDSTILWSWIFTEFWVVSNFNTRWQSW